jgi:hypothetical protein
VNAPVVTPDTHATVASPTHLSIHVGGDAAGPSIDFVEQLRWARRLRGGRRRGSANSRAERHDRDQLEHGTSSLEEELQIPFQ